MCSFVCAVFPNFKETINFPKGDQKETYFCLKGDQKETNFRRKGDLCIIFGEKVTCNTYSYLTLKSNVKLVENPTLHQWKIMED